MFHTARWDYGYTGGNQREPVLDKLSDKNVAIVGTGASAIQAVPFLARYAKQLYVLQRTASTVDARINTPTDESWLASLRPGWQRERQMNFHRAAIDGLTPGEQDRICDIWTEINRNLEAEFQESDYPQTVDDFLSRREMMDFRVMERLRARVDAVVKRQGDRRDSETLVSTHVQATGFERRVLSRVQQVERATSRRFSHTWVRASSRAEVSCTSPPNTTSTV